MGEEKRVKLFEVRGEFVEKGGRKRFTKIVEAQSHRFALEKVLCLIGSKHKVKRKHIFLEEAREVNELGEGGEKKTG